MKDEKEKQTDFETKWNKCKKIDWQWVGNEKKNITGHIKCMDRQWDLACKPEKLVKKWRNNKHQYLANFVLLPQKFNTHSLAMLNK